VDPTGFHIVERLAMRYLGDAHHPGGGGDTRRRGVDGHSPREHDMPDRQPPTRLADMVRRQTAHTVFNVFSQTVDKVAEEMALELMRDPDFHDEMRTLVRAAFTAALHELTQPPSDE
jgi:hypothetical protein